MQSDEKPDPAFAARDTALRLLGRREHSRRELLTKLAQRGYESSLAQSVIDELKKEGLQSDLRYAEAFVHNRRGRLQGPLKIQSELQRRGVDKSVIHKALDPYSGEWAKLAAAFVERRGMVDELEDFEQRQKVYRRLANRGFSHGEAIAAIEVIKNS
jgi:regulatory protein